MDSRIAVLVTWVIFGGLLAQYLYTPFPENAKHPVKQRFSRAMVRVMHDIAFIGSSLGLGSEVNITRRVSELNTLFSKEPDDGTLWVEDKVFDGVQVRVYTPRSLSVIPSPALINIHGGGWAYLDIDGYDAFCRRVAKHANIVVISIDYRRAPEYPFPVPLDDCVTAIKYFISNAQKFNVDQNRIGLTGHYEFFGRISYGHLQVIKMSERKQQQQSRKNPPQPIDEGWSWLILAAAVLVTFLWGGVVRAFGVLFVELRTEFGLSTSLLSLVVALHTALFTIGGLFALTYGVRYLTARQCVFIGAILAVLSFVFSSLAKNGLILFVSYGFLLGLSFSFAIGPSTLLVSLYFKEKRNLTTWCLQMSPSIGAMLSAPLLRGLIDKYLLKGCLLIMAAILGHFLLASVLMRPPELYKKWQRLKKKIEKTRMKTTLLGKDGFPVEPFRARSPTSDSTFSPLARQAMLQRMKSRNDDDEENPTSVQSDKSKKKLIEPEQKKTENIEERGHDTNPTKQHNESWRQRAMYASFDFGISAPFLEQRYNSSRRRTDSDKSNKSDKSDNSFLSENALVKGCLDVTLKKCFKTSVLCNPSFVLFCVGFTLGIPTAILVLFLPDVGIDNHLDNTQSASLVSVYMIGEIMGQITAVFLSYRRIDNFLILITSLIAIGIIYNLLPFFFNLGLLILFSLIIGICSGPFQSLHANIIRRCVRPEEVSSGMCLLHFAQGLSWTVVIAITGFLRDLTGSYNMSFTILGSLGVASSIFIAASRLCLRKHREVYHPETGELENQEIIIK